MCILSPYVDELWSGTVDSFTNFGYGGKGTCTNVSTHVHSSTHALSLPFSNIPQGLFRFSSTLMISTSTYSSFVKDLNTSQ